MRRVGAEEPAAVGSQVLDGDDGGDRSAADFLRLVLAVFRRSHGARFDRSDLGGGVHCHRDAVGQQHHGHHQAQRHELVGHNAPHVEIIVAHVRVAAQPANNRRQPAQPDARRKEHVPNDEEDLAEIGEILLAAVVLQVGVRKEGRYRVEDRRRREHSFAVRVQSDHRLDGQHEEPEDEHHGVGEHHGDRIMLPILRSGVNAPLDPAEPNRRTVAAVHDPSQIAAQRNGQQRGDRQQRKRQKPNVKRRRHRCVLFRATVHGDCPLRPARPVNG